MRWPTGKSNIKHDIYYIPRNAWGACRGWTIFTLHSDIFKTPLWHEGNIYLHAPTRPPLEHAMAFSTNNCAITLHFSNKGLWHPVKRTLMTNVWSFMLGLQFQHAGSERVSVQTGAKYSIPEQSCSLQTKRKMPARYKGLCVVCDSQRQY